MGSRGVNSCSKDNFKEQVKCYWWSYLKESLINPPQLHILFYLSYKEVVYLSFIYSTSSSVQHQQENMSRTKAYSSCNWNVIATAQVALTSLSMSITSCLWKKEVPSHLSYRAKQLKLPAVSLVGHPEDYLDLYSTRPQERLGRGSEQGISWWRRVNSIALNSGISANVSKLHAIEFRQYSRIFRTQYLPSEKLAIQIK